jgi:hypothetical protein
MGTAAGAFAGLAGQAGEEFRVERALRELGRPLSEIYRQELGPMAIDYARSLREPFDAHQSSWDPVDLGPLLDAAITGFDHLIPVMAYLLGDDVGAGLRNPPPAALGPARWIYEGYQALYEPLSQLPSANTACSIQDLDDLLEPVESALKRWFAHIGFRWTDSPDGYHLHLLDPERMDSELGRLAA